jgi:hypothetical protein
MRRGKLRGLALALMLFGFAAGEARASDGLRLWNERVRISGSADLGYFGGGAESVVANDGFKIWDARLFVDAELGDALGLGSSTWVRNVGFSFEWNLVRLGRTANDVGLAYLDLEGLGQSPWFNLRVGRFQIPFGEAYKRYSKGYADRPLLSTPVGGPWWWDEGVLLHGSAPDAKLGYLASLTNGDTEFNGDADAGMQATLKLWTQPWKSLYLSLSGLWTNELGTTEGALWLGEGWARPFGSGVPPSVPNVIDGGVAAADPDGIGETWALGADVILTPLEGVRLWLAGGRYAIESDGASIYDRDLTYWIAEAIVDGDVIAPELRPFFLALRADGVTTGDEDRGYLLDVRYTGGFGYNIEGITSYAVGIGWHLGEYVTLRTEYSFRDVGLVRGARAFVPGESGNEDLYGIAFGIRY